MSATGIARYPVRVTARYGERLSRWLWLVKFILVIPHLLVLIGLWIGAFFATLAAGVAILVTGRYPRSLFGYTVGVLRWTWRVSFYSTGAFGTDRYPPFRLSADPGYPADLEVDYPERLSRGLVLVKWWLLAIPHYLVIAFFTGGWGVLRGGLISLLALISAIAVLFTGRYPRSIFDLVIGLNRWTLRVAGYALLMTDEYPPFRLDQGGAEPSLSERPITPRPDVKPSAPASA